MTTKNQKLLLFVAVLSCVIIPTTAYAQTDIISDTKILGLHPIVAALGITLLGIGLRTVIGIAGKPRSEFNAPLLMTSLIIGFFATIQLVIVSLQHIPEDANDLIILSIITGEIATVMGIDAGVKSAGKRAQAKMVDIFSKTNEKPDET